MSVLLPIMSGFHIHFSHHRKKFKIPLCQHCHIWSTKQNWLQVSKSYHISPSAGNNTSHSRHLGLVLAIHSCHKYTAIMNSYRVKLHVGMNGARNRRYQRERFAAVLSESYASRPAARVMWRAASKYGTGRRNVQTFHYWTVQLKK